MIPERDTICHALQSMPLRLTTGTQHVPTEQAVEHDVHEGTLEAQFSACLYCQQPIGRFRKLDGSQSWFDHWGVIVTSERVS